MALYIKDQEVASLARELAGLKGSSKTEAVKNAIRQAIEAHKNTLPMRQRLAKSFAMAKSFGPYALSDHKKDMDELWGEA